MNSGELILVGVEDRFALLLLLSGTLDIVRLNGFAERGAGGSGDDVLEAPSSNEPSRCGVDRVPDAGSDGPRGRACVGVPDRVGGLLGGTRPERLCFR